MEGLCPDKEGNTDNGSSNVAENQDFYFLKFLHQPLAIDVVKRRPEASAKDEEVAGEVFQRTKRCLTQISPERKTTPTNPMARDACVTA